VISNDQYLRPMLDSGSSRVFNCNDRARKLVLEGAKEPYFFRLPKMHGLVIIKEAALESAHRGSNAPIVCTKLYLPYNEEDIYEGGRSILFNDPRLLEILNELFGLKGATLAEANLQHDMKILGILDRLPSLDGFLMRDALELEGIAANENYFEVSGTERAAIYEFVRRKFEPLVRAACEEEATVSNKVNQLIDKVWEAKDKKALEPLIRAFRFPDDEALAIFASWKGINFYTYEYYRAKQQREQFGLWLRDRATPRNFVSKTDQDYLNQMRRATVERLREQWNAVEAIAREYESLYANFLRKPEGVVEFLNFLRKSREIYWRMGEALSKINHAIHCWDSVSAGYADRRLPADKLSYILEILQLVLSSSEHAASAVVWE
jgi:hypothetical protein